ncbi:hypothetical protein COLO4_05955 [Corchorus olitorius]|uniref:Uncharacterized protein n=1 Tax=Corchorus olitorius TaxID=93759 RepID=A0A1R3KPE8_9ROSI|nr:hypothetical protein COLO4_05955 [Corchorus olitorius]
MKPLENLGMKLKKLPPSLMVFQSLKIEEDLYYLDSIYSEAAQYDHPPEYPLNIAQPRPEPVKVKDCPIYEQLCTIFTDLSDDGKYAQSSHFEGLDKAVGNDNGGLNLSLPFICAISTYNTKTRKAHEHFHKFQL